MVLLVGAVVGVGACRLYLGTIGYQNVAFEKYLEPIVNKENYE